jgi:N-ethylmaleimide reductase
MMNLLTLYKLGDLKLSNRMVMAPMTRCRAIEGNIPNPLAVTYYTQRAAAGLIITEGSQVSPQGVGFNRTPGIYSQEQVEGWMKITDAVHRGGGHIFLQLWHVGRMSHPDYLGGNFPVAPSAIPVDEEIHTPAGKKKITVRTATCWTSSCVTGQTNATMITGAAWRTVCGSLLTLPGRLHVNGNHKG